MTHAADTAGGIPGLASVPWGTHCCHFYDGRSDLVDTLVPFFKAGLDANNACLWVTSEPFTAEDARSALGSVVSDLGEREQRGQIEIIDHETWYLHNRETDASATLAGWLRRERRALESGYEGLRLTGNTYWLERDNWSSFVEYERLVNEAFTRQRIVALCSYCSSKCSASDVLDVVANHEFTIARRNDTWQVVESTALTVARRDLERLKRAARELRESDQRKDDFIAMMSHELRNPLAPIATAEQLMRLRGATAAYTTELDTIRRQVKHLTRLVDDVLDVARISRGKTVLRRRPVELAEVVARAVEMIGEARERQRHELLVAVPPRGLEVEVDDDRMTQVLVNVLTNAIKYTPPGGRIELVAAGSESQVSVQISDNGPGIPGELVGRVFDRFVQGPRLLDRAQGGLGLGLPIVKGFVEAHGGSVELTSAEGAGTTVRIELPRAAARAVELAAPLPHDEPAPSPRQRARVLVVDDNEDAAMLLAEFLREHGYDTAVASDGRAALESAARHPPNIALLDIGLPDLDGYELGRRLLQLGMGGELALLAVSGYGGSAIKQSCADAGFRQHFTKPVDLTQLLGALESLTSSAVH